MGSTVNSRLAMGIRADLPGRFNELDILRRHRDRYEMVVAGEVLPPYEVMIHPSSTCNLRCSWCIGENVPIINGGLSLSASKFASERLPDVLHDVRAMRSLVDDLINYERTLTPESGGDPVTFRVETVNLSGLIGDPMMARESVVAAVDLLRGAGRRVGMFTSGTLVKQQDLAPIIHGSG